MQASHNFCIRTASVQDLKDIIASLKPCPDVRMVRSDELTATEVATLNRHVVENSAICYVPPTREHLEILLGARVCQDGEQPVITIGGTGYRFENNKFNRPLSMSRIYPATKVGTYSNLAQRGLWGSSAGLLQYDWNAQTVSAQHTSIAMLVCAILYPESLKDLQLLCYFGLPPQFRDFTDKGRARNKVQDSYSDDSLFPESLMSEYQLERTPEGKDRVTERTGLLKLRSKIASSVLNRFAGKDVSKTGDKLSWSDEKSFSERFASSSDLDVLCVKLWESARGQSGKLDRDFIDLFELSIIGTGLILASNSQAVLDAEIAESVVREPEETPEDFAERKLSAMRIRIAPDSLIRIDWAMVETVLSKLSESTDKVGPYSASFSDLYARKAKDKRTDNLVKLLYSKLSIASMSAFVELLKNEINGTEPTSVWTSYRVVDNKAPTAYRNFGGMDVGYTSARKSKDNDE